MLDFLQPFRCKLGIVMLLLTCALTAGWMRSYAQIDLIFLPGVRVVSSANGDCALSRTVTILNLPGFGDFVASIEFESTSFFSQFKWRTFDDASTMIVLSQMIPYWSIVGPLTAFCAWLLLSKPRSEATISTDTPTPSSATSVTNAREPQQF